MSYICTFSKHVRILSHKQKLNSHRTSEVVLGSEVFLNIMNSSKGSTALYIAILCEVESGSKSCIKSARYVMSTRLRQVYLKVSCWQNYFYIQINHMKENWSLTESSICTKDKNPRQNSPALNIKHYSITFTVFYLKSITTTI